MRKYKELSKDEKKKIQEKYKKEYAKSDFEARIKRLLIYAIVGYVFAIALVIYSFIRPEETAGNLLIAIPLFIAATIFLIGRYYAKRMLYDKIASKKN